MADKDENSEDFFTDLFTKFGKQIDLGQTSRTPAESEESTESLRSVYDESTEDPENSQEPRQEPVSEESTVSPQSLRSVYDESTESPQRVYGDSTESLRSVYDESTVSPRRVSDESTVSLQSVYGESTESLHEPSPYILSEYEYAVFKWLQSKGTSGYFSPGQIHQELDMSRAMSYRVLKSLEKNHIVRLGKYSKKIGLKTFKLLVSKVYTESMVSLRSVYGESTVSLQRVQGESTESLRSVYDESTYRTNERFINSISFVLENSEFWKGTRLTLQKIEKDWVGKNKLDPALILENLQMGEHAQEVRNAENPAKYLFTTLKNGGLERPSGFEFPEERKARLQRESLQAREKAVQELKDLEAKKAALEEEEMLNRILEDPEKVGEMVQELEKVPGGKKRKAAISKFKETGEVNAMLKQALRNYFGRT